MSTFFNCVVLALVVAIFSCVLAGGGLPFEEQLPMLWNAFVPHNMEEVKSKMGFHIMALLAIAFCSRGVKPMLMPKTN